ncbi:MAG: energy transducer TonB [Candidatus Sulfopaludibacter sp.]|nr:energy transducer TonB [Candidatus Sulfopaludibacter sp.]
MPNYVWSDPSRPVTIRLSLSVLGRLALPGPAGGSAGLLLGRSVLEDGRPIISIENFEPAELEHLDEALARQNDAVGMYRAQAGREFPQIQSDEALLFGQYFTRPDALFLLLHPRLERAAFFIIEGDEFSLVHQFTFRAAKPPDARKWPITRTQQRALEVLALVSGVVAGAALFQHFQPPHFIQPVSAMPQPVAATRPVPSYPADPEPLPSPFAPPEAPVPAERPKPARPVRKAGAERNAEEAPRPSPPSTPPKAVPEPTPAPADAPPPARPAAPAPAPVPAPVRNIPREPEPGILVDAEPVKGSRIGQVVGHIPLLRRLHKPAPPLAPPEPVRRVDPKLSSEERAELTNTVDVDVRVYVDEAGKVEYAELMSNAKHHPRLSTAAVYASRRWDFRPAVQGGQHVPGEVILHFRFVPPEPPPPPARGQN